MTSTLDRLLQDAVAQVESLPTFPPFEVPPVDLPSSLADLVENNDIRIPPLPTNAREICVALGDPNSAQAAGHSLASVIEQFGPVPQDVRQSIGVVIRVVFESCPTWMPFVELAVARAL